MAPKNELNSVVLKLRELTVTVFPAITCSGVVVKLKENGWKGSTKKHVHVTIRLGAGCRSEYKLTNET